MLSLYEILKASKTGLAPDMWTALAGMNWGSADSGHEVKELTGIPPLSFTADGTPLLDYLISGNTIQNGTPTPSNPVEVNGVGERTENIFDDTKIINIPNLGDRYGFEASSGTYSIYNDTDNNVYSGTNNWTGRQIACTPHSIATIQLDVGVGVIGGFFMALNSASQGGCTIVEGSTPPDHYIPYGYKIPISNGQQTTNIYLGSTQTTRCVKKLVLTGQENWGSSHLDVNLFALSGIDDTAKGLEKTTKSTHYRSQTNVESWSLVIDNQVCFHAYSNSNILYIRDSTYATVADFTTYLSQQYANGTPVTVWYALATPETGIVNEPLMKIGNYADTVSYEQAGVQIPTLHGNTVIDVETTPKPSQMYIKYQK